MLKEEIMGRGRKIGWEEEESVGVSYCAVVMQKEEDDAV